MYSSWAIEYRGLEPESDNAILQIRLSGLTAVIIPFNKPFIAGKELYYIAQAVAFGNIAGDGVYTKRCARILEEQFGVHRVLMTPSCTAALEMAAILCEVGPGDEVILPSYTFVSTANAFVLRGAKPVFVDIRPDTLNLDEELIEQAITDRTKVICPVHYAGVGCEMDRIMEIADRHGLLVVEDAAQGVNAFHRGRALGSIGHLGAYSFHETKNYICGEGGALCINDERLVERAEIIRDKGTNRQQFFRGAVDKYTWVDIGSSCVPSEISSAFLYGQLEMLEPISKRRREIFESYAKHLEPLASEGLRLAAINVFPTRRAVCPAQARQRRRRNLAVDRRLWVSQPRAKVRRAPDPEGRVSPRSLGLARDPRLLGQRRLPLAHQPNEREFGHARHTQRSRCAGRRRQPAESQS